MEHWDLIAKDLSGEISEKEKLQLNQWVEESEENKKEYHAAKDAWDMTSFEAVYAPNVEVAWKNVKSKTKTQVSSIKEPQKKKLNSFLIASVFVGVIGIGTILNFWLNQEDKVLLTTTDAVEQFELPDGTSVWLNKNSELSYTENYNDKERNVQLNGEAYFDVTKNADKPFIVSSKISTVKVLGTAFSLKAFDNQKIADLAVNEGKVSFSDGNQEVIFVKGEKGVLSDTKGIEKFSINPNEFAWKKGVLVYENSPLEDVFFDLGSHYGIVINTSSNKEVLNCRFTGELSTKNIDQAIEILSLTTGLEINRSGEELSVSGDGC